MTHGNGWYGFALDPADTAACLAGLRTARAAHRAAEPRSASSRSASRRAARSISTRVKRFADLGVHRLIPYWPFPTESALRDRIARFADEVIAKL